MSLIEQGRTERCGEREILYTLLLSYAYWLSRGVQDFSPPPYRSLSRLVEMTKGFIVFKKKLI